MFVCLALKHVGLLSVICGTGRKALPYFAKRTEEKLEISLKIAILRQEIFFHLKGVFPSFCILKIGPRYIQSHPTFRVEPNLNSWTETNVKN